MPFTPPHDFIDHVDRECRGPRPGRDIGRTFRNDERHRCGSSICAMSARRRAPVPARGAAPAHKPAQIVPLRVGLADFFSFHIRSPNSAGDGSVDYLPRRELPEQLDLARDETRGFRLQFPVTA